MTVSTRTWRAAALAVLTLLSLGDTRFARLEAQQQAIDPALLNAYRWRSIGPDRGGRSIAAAGVKGRPREAYFGAVGGGLWKTVDAGNNWAPVTDGLITSSSVGAVAVSESNPDVLYIDEGSVLTSAGSAAGIDLLLHIVRLDYGAAIANQVAKRLVVPPHRDGGQAQYVSAPVRESGERGLGPLLDWVRGHLPQPLAIAQLARRAAMSERNFARRFRAETGTTPHRWLTHERLLAAQRLLETTDDSIDRIAEAVGLQTAPTLRHHFRRAFRTSPAAYRRRFTLTPRSV